MAYTGPKVRLSRRLGIALTPKAAKYLDRRPYPPGQHGTRRSGKPSPYKLRLLEKQKLRYQYDVPEGQLRRIVEHFASGEMIFDGYSPAGVWLTQRYAHVSNYTDLPRITLEQVQHFFEHYKDLEPGKLVKTHGWGDAAEARNLIAAAIARARAA